MKISRLIVGALALGMLSLAALPAAAAGIQGDAGARIKGTYVGTNAKASVTAAFDLTAFTQFTSGVATGQANKLFIDSRTLTSAASENLDLAGGVSDPFGATLTLVKVKAIYIKAAATNTNNVVVGAAASNPFTGPLGGTTPTITIPPGGYVLLVHPGAGWTVTAGTGDLLKVLNGGSGSSVVYDVAIFGTDS